MRKIIVFSGLLLLLCMGYENTSAQCPMCKASVESSIKGTKNKVGLGLNNGILYLLAMPYLAVGIVGVLWYKKYKKKNTVVDINEDPIILN